MCARRFLVAMAILTLLVVAGAFAIFQFGQSVLVKTATPVGHYQAPPAASGPDYSNFEAWISRPDVFSSNGVDGVDDDPSRWPPPQVAHHDLNGATFYVHPTTYLERDRWNAPLRPGGETESRSRLFVKTQATAVNPAGDVWAPRYRQAAYGAFLLDNKDARSALNLAYEDVSAAFDRFLVENPDVPIILAGHSQGALHLIRLLREKVAGKPVEQRLVAAYVVGWPISLSADLPAIGLPACTKPEQTGCILSWMTFREPANPDLILSAWEKSAGLNGNRRRRKDVLCTNPITGTQNGSDLRGVGGIVVPTANMRDVTINYNSLGAHCDDGLLIADGELPAIGPFALPGNNYHVYDYALFWGAIKQDSRRRWWRWTDDRR